MPGDQPRPLVDVRHGRAARRCAALPVGAPAQPEITFEPLKTALTRGRGPAHETGPLQKIEQRVSDDLDPRSTVIVLGDARTNGREPHAQIFGRIAAQAGRMFWLNPEPRLYWNYGDSVMAAYEPYCDGVFECWTTKQLEQFVNALAGTPEAV